MASRWGVLTRHRLVSIKPLHPDISTPVYAARMAQRVRGCHGFALDAGRYIRYWNRYNFRRVQISILRIIRKWSPRLFVARSHNFFSPVSLIYGVTIYRNVAKLWLFRFLTPTTVNRRFSRWSIFEFVINFLLFFILFKRDVFLYCKNKIMAFNKYKIYFWKAYFWKNK